MFRYVLLALFLLSFTACDSQESEVYLFSFFKDNGQDGLHMAWSEDGMNWEALNEKKSLLTPSVGKDKLMRDPCIIKGGDGKYHMVWTISWNEQGVGYATSSDLVNWSEQRYISVMHHEPGARNSWAPELFYDDESEDYMIYWATTITGRFPETDTPAESKYNHRMYYTITKDFKEFSPTEILYNDGFNVIDATIQKHEGEYIMFLKNETVSPTPEKNIRIARSAKLSSDYSSASASISPDAWVEGPTVTKVDGNWVVYFDLYKEHRMGAVSSPDLENWTDISDDIHFPEGTRHGTVFKVNKSVLENMRNALKK